MTEKSYGGNSGIPQPKPTAKAADTNKYNPTLPKNSQNKSEMTNLKPEEITKLKQAGEIAKQVKDYAKTIIKKGAPLLEIAEKIEGKIKELGGETCLPHKSLNR